MVRLGVKSSFGSVNRLLLSLICVILIPLLAVQAGVYYAWYESRVEAEEHSNVEMARSLSMAVDAVLRDVLREELAIGSVLRKSPHFAAVEISDILRLNRDQYISVRDFHWVSPQGLIQSSSDPNTIGISLVKRQYFKELADGNETIVSDPIISLYSCRTVVVVGRRIEDANGAIDGIMLAVIDPVRLMRVTQSLPRREQGIFRVFDAQGRPLFETGPAGPSESWLAFDSVLREAIRTRQPQHGRVVVPNEGRPRIAARVPLEVAGWFAGATRPMDEVVQPIARSLSIVAAVVLLVTALSLVGGVYFSQRLVRPIRQLRQRIKQIGQGQLSGERVVGGTAELEELSGGLELAASQLLAAREAQQAQVTRLNEAMAELRDAQRELEQLAQFPSENPNPVMRVAADGRLLYANRASELLLKTWEARVGEAVPEMIAEIADGVVAAGSTRELDLTVGDRTLSFMFAAQSGWEYANIYARDITERRAALEALRLSEERFRQLFSGMTEGFALHEILCDEAGKPVDYRFLELNPAFERLTGLRREDVIGRTVKEVLPRTEDAWIQVYGKVALTGEAAHFENYSEAIGKHYEVYAYRPAAGQFAVIFLDVTERKKAVEALKRTAADLARSNKDLEQFAYVASHDLQEPLRMVTGYVQLIERRYKDKLDKDANEFIAYTIDGVTRMQQLINDLLAYSRVGTRGRDFKLAPMQEALDTAVGNLQMAIAQEQATVTHDPMPTVRADTTQMVQLLQNLLANAIKFHGPEKPVVHVGVAERADEYEFCVSDNGIGIEATYLERIFRIFQRLHTRTDYPGTGIGLAICKRIVERHSGRIWACSEAGKGSRFCFTLPK